MATKQLNSSNTLLQKASSTSSSTPSPTLTITPLRISTMVTTANWGAPISLPTLFEHFHNIAIPIWYPCEGILKFEFKNMVLGACYKDIFTERKITNKAFFNQSTMVLRRYIPGTTTFKEVNVKLFANGGIQMTGVVSEEFAKDSLQFLLSEIKKLEVSPFLDGIPTIDKFSIQLINTDYSLNKYVNQNLLHKILVNDYNLFSTLEKTIYQGINTKFYYNKQNAVQRGVCTCEKSCKGQGLGDGEGQCKKITISIFRTGKIIITGGRHMEQIYMAYDFLNTILKRHTNEVLIDIADTNIAPAESCSQTMLQTLINGMSEIELEAE
jgi:TATA-box binding protein (TBP) (component of TFIID and TFIIIB)